MINQRKNDYLQKVMGMLQMQKEQDNFSCHVLTETSPTLHTTQLQYPLSHTFAKNMVY
jgi:hypothetical protein